MEGQIGLKTAQVCLKMLDAGKIEIFTDDKQTCIFGYPMFRETHTYFLPRKNVYLTDSFGFVTIITRTVRSLMLLKHFSLFQDICRVCRSSLCDEYSLCDCQLSNMFFVKTTSLVFVNIYIIYINTIIWGECISILSAYPPSNMLTAGFPI